MLNLRPLQRREDKSTNLAPSSASDDLNELDETRRDGLDFCKPLEMDKIGWGVLLAKFYTRMKSCRLFMIKNIGMKLKPFLVITTVASSISMFSILCSNFLFFTLLKTTEQGDYLLERMIVQEGILEILRDLPVSSGLAIRRDVGGVEEFYSLISGSEVKLERGFIDLTSLAILAGFKFHKNMTAMGVQVIGTLLNKTVSMGENCWGKRWSIIPKPPQCYALGDIKFGFITYNVLTGLLLRNLFPDPNVLCRYLDKHEIGEINKFRIQDELFWILRKFLPTFSLRLKNRRE